MVILEFYHKIWLGVIECLVIHQGGVIYIGAQLEFHPSHKILNAAIMSHVKILSHKKEQNCAICRDMDGPRDCHTQWSKSEREKQIPYINTQMWNVGKQYSWTYLQSRNRDIHREPVYGHQGGEKRWDELGDWDWHLYIYTALVHAKSLQLCPTLCNPMDCSLSGSSVHGILQAKVLEWVAISSSRGSYWPMIKPALCVAPVLQADSFPLSHQGSPYKHVCVWSR